MTVDELIAKLSALPEEVRLRKVVVVANSYNDPYVWATGVLVGIDAEENDSEVYLEGEAY